MNNAYSILGLCRRAGMLIIGRDAVMDTIRAGKAELLILSSDASPRHKQEAEAIGYTGNILSLKGDMNEVGYFTGKRACVFAVTDKGFADTILKKLNNQ